MRKLLVGILLVATSLFLVSCGSKVGKNGELIDFSQSQSKKSTIRVWIDDEKGDYMKEVIKEFNKVYPNIVVEHQHKGTVEMREHLKTFGPSGNGADVFQFPHDHLAQAVLEDLVLPLPEATADLVKERSHELGVDIATLSYNSANGSFDPNDPNAVPRLYAVPTSVEAVGLYYNKDLVATPATTYEEIITQGLLWNKETAIGSSSGRTNEQEGHYYLGITNHWADSYFIQHIYSAFGFTPFGPNLNDPSEVGFEKDGKLERALEWMTTDLRPIITGTSGTGEIKGGTLFEEGKIPYVIGGPWNAEAFKAAKINYGVAPLPSIKGQETKPYAGAMMASVYKYSKNTEDAIKFVEFLSTDIAMELQYEMKAKLPALRQDLLGNIEGITEDEALMVMSEQLENAVPMPTIPEVTYFWGPGEAMVNQVWTGSKTIKQALKEAEESYKTLRGLVE